MTKRMETKYEQINRRIDNCRKASREARSLEMRATWCLHMSRLIIRRDMMIVEEAEEIAV